MQSLPAFPWRRLSRHLSILLVSFSALLLSVPAAAQNDPCEVTDDGTGTVELPPPGCAYLSPDEVHLIIDGLPPGTTIELSPIHRGFFCAQPAGNGPCLVEPGGGLGGQREVFDSIVVFELTGTGELDGFQRIVSLQLQAETHTGPRDPGNPVQAFETDFFRLQGQLSGDPDFAQLIVIGGTAFGLPSPGQTTLTDLGNGDFNVDSFFDIAYQIDFQGAPGGALDGLAGSTQGTTRVTAMGERDPCLEPDNGSGTVELPPPGCDYLSPAEVHRIIDGLPPGTEIELSPRHARFVCETTPCGQPGGSLGGEVELFDSILVLQLEGTGRLDRYFRTLRVPVQVETHTGPREPGAPVQSFPTDMFRIQGELFGDPDFAQLTITGGTGNGLPSPGHTILERLPGGDFRVDSFFDIAYQIDFVGAPGGALEGLSGTTRAQIRMEASPAKDESVEPPIEGTVTLPPLGGQYVSPDELHMILDGLPPGTAIELDPSHNGFLCAPPEPCGTPGGKLGGEIEVFDSTLDLELTGTGSLVALKRNLSIPMMVETHTGPRNPDDPVQAFDTEMFRIQGELTGDPDFAQLTITGGTGNGLPSPGHTTLTEQQDGSFLVDSFFDITYQIDFVGAPGGQLDGLSGSTQGQVRVTACNDPEAPPRPGRIEIVKDAIPDSATDFAFTGDLGDFTLQDNGEQTSANNAEFFNFAAGTYMVTETPTAGWTLVRIECDDPSGNSTVDLGQGKATIELASGEKVTCTFTNAETSSIIFRDGFETGDAAAWSSFQP